jgi:hypothetical protein
MSLRLTAEVSRTEASRQNTFETLYPFASTMKLFWNTWGYIDPSCRVPLHLCPIAKPYRADDPAKQIGDELNGAYATVPLESTATIDMHRA